MPEVDRQAVIAHLAEAQHRIPVIVCTAALPRSTQDFDLKFIRAVLRKPVDIEQLMSTVHRWSIPTTSRCRNGRKAAKVMTFPVRPVAGR